MTYSSYSYYHKSYGHNYYKSSYGDQYYKGSYSCDPCDYGSDTSKLIVLEAEDFASCGFSTVCSTSASGGEIVKLSHGDYGKLSKTFNGEDATYKVSLFAQDEADGASTLRVWIGGEVAAIVKLDQQTDGNGSNNGAFSQIDLGEFDIDCGDKITIEAWKDCGEYVRLDKLMFEKVEEPAATVCDVCVTFDGCDPTRDELIESARGWYSYKDMVYSTGNKDADITFAKLDVNGPVDISFDAFTTNIGVFESNDTFTVQVRLDDGSWETLDVFTRSGDSFVGSHTGQSYGESTSTLSYTVGDSGTQSVQLRMLTDFSWCDENILLDNVCFKSSCVDCEDTKVTFDDLPAGTIVSNQFDGFTVEAQRKHDGAGSANDAMLFDTDNPTGGDWDLKYSGKGKVIIISEDGDSHDPDDNYKGGTITFTFDNPSSVTSLEVLDIEETTGTIDVYGESGLIKTVAIPATGDNGAALVSINAEGATRMVVNLPGSGAINDLCFEAGEAPATGALSGRYFCDTDNDDIDDGQAVDPGIAGVVVTLLDATGAVVTDSNNVAVTTTTDAEGNYIFEGLEAGEYGVQFTDPDGVLEGKILVADNVGGDDTVDSDAIGDTTLSTITGITVTANNETTDNDAGAEYTASLGDTVFHDVNANGVQDAGEEGIAGATVNLLDAAGTVIGTDTTDGDGVYGFEDLAPGDYRVEFVQPGGFTEASPENQGGDDTADSDGVAEAGNFRSGLVSLDAGENDPTIDMGFFNLAGLGDKVFLDENGDGIQQAGEAGVDGVTVELKDANDVVLATTTTANGGQYSFTGLVPGTYSVAFIAPAGMAFTTANAGDDTLDSDADPVTGMTQQVTLTSGEFNGTLDAGLIVPNTDPFAGDDAGKACADTALVIDDLFANDGDADGHAIAVQALNGTSFLSGDTIILNDIEFEVTDRDGVVTTETFSGIEVSLNGSTLTVDASTALADLEIGESANVTFSYDIGDGNGGEATADINLSFCGAKNTLESIDAMLEGAEVTYVIGDVRTRAALEDAWTLDLQSSTSADIAIGEYTAAYCIDSRADFDVEVFSSATVSVATEANAAAAGVLNADKIDEVNWILNQDFTSIDNGDGNGLNFTDLEIQEAIWTLLNGETFHFDNFPSLVPDNQNGFRDGVEIATRENVEDIVNLALAQDGFVAGEGDIVGLILDPFDPASQDQPFIIGVEFDTLAQECLCA